MAVLSATLAGCASSRSGPVGAPVSRGPAGPSVVQRAPLPRMIPRVAVHHSAHPVANRKVTLLSARIDQALTRIGDAQPATRLKVKTAAGNQLQVEWSTGVTWPDRHAALTVRRHVLAILRVVRRSAMRLGSVLMLATGPTVRPRSGRVTTSVVVRAKFSHALVAATDWTAVAPQAVLGMCDDKPAVLALGYR